MSMLNASSPIDNVVIRLLCGVSLVGIEILDHSIHFSMQIKYPGSPRWHVEPLAPQLQPLKTAPPLARLCTSVLLSWRPNALFTFTSLCSDFQAGSICNIPQRQQLAIVAEIPHTRSIYCVRHLASELIHSWLSAQIQIIPFLERSASHSIARPAKQLMFLGQPEPF